MTPYRPFLHGRISDIARRLGAPDQQRNERGAMHRCSWDCGCEAINSRGLCIEDGWRVESCLRHPELTD